nr:ER membrane protein complex subunit 2-like [Ipomoea batatas]GMC93783.1 ER membrane protein complex subunit 2-like [Ipomoea batatas]
MNHASQVRRKKSIQEADELEFYVARRLGATTWSLPGPMTAQMDEARRRSCVQRERIHRKLFPRSVWLLGCLFFMYGLWFGVGGLVAAGRNFNKYKQAAFCYEELILSHPMVPLYDLAYADVWTSVLGMCMDVVVRFVKIKMEGHWDTYKQAAFCYEELILSHPMVPLYDLAYADVSDLFASFMSLLQI